MRLRRSIAVGARRIEARMAEAVTQSALHGPGVVDRALGLAAIAGRFAEGDLGSIIIHGATTTRPAGPPAEHTLAAGTAMWSALGVSDSDDEDEEGRP
jgi:hypothetical protein